MLLPLGWLALGTVALRDRLPSRMFDLFGSGGGDLYTWYAVLALLSVSVIQINGNVVNMGLGGSARDEFAARFGAVVGHLRQADHDRDVDVPRAGRRGHLPGTGPSSRTRISPGASCQPGELLGPGAAWAHAGRGPRRQHALDREQDDGGCPRCFVRNLYRPFASLVGDAAARCWPGAWPSPGPWPASVGAALVMSHVLTVTKLVLTLNLPFGALPCC